MEAITIGWEPVKNLWKTYELSWEKTCEILIFICFFKGFWQVFHRAWNFENLWTGHFSQGQNLWQNLWTNLWNKTCQIKPLKKTCEKTCEKESCSGAFSQVFSRGLKSQNLWTGTFHMVTTCEKTREKRLCNRTVKKPVKDNFGFELVHCYMYTCTVVSKISKLWL